MAATGQYNTTRLQSIVESLEKSSLSTQNVEDLKKLKAEMKAEDLSDHTILALLYSFQRMADIIDFELRSASREDLIQLVGKINSCHEDYGDFSAWTRADDRKNLQKFYSWLKGNRNPRITDFMSVVPKKQDLPVKDPQDLINVREAEKLINATSNTRDKALMALMWDSGARPKEIRQLDWKDISFEDEMMTVHFRNGKTGPRRVSLVESIPLMKKWHSETPAPLESDPVFCKIRGSPDRVVNRVLSKQIKQARKNTDLPERRNTNPYAWRKARATDMASKGMTQPNMCKFFGWANNSNAPLVYIRLAEKDVRKNMRGIYPGLEQKENDGPKFLGENIPEYSQSDLRAYSSK